MAYPQWQHTPGVMAMAAYFYHSNRYFEIVMFYLQTTNMWTPPCVGFWHLANVVSLTTIWLSCLNGRCQITWKLMNAKRKK